MAISIDSSAAWCPLNLPETGEKMIGIIMRGRIEHQQIKQYQASTSYPQKKSPSQPVYIALQQASGRYIELVQSMR